jgi:hypothetical protein
MFRIIVIPEAASDINQAAEWYLKEGNEFVSSRFKQHLINAVEQIQNTNIEHAVVYNGLNRVFVKRFPFTIILQEIQLSN